MMVEILSCISSGMFITMGIWAVRPWYFAVDSTVVLDGD
jgi:hypothetical protein